MLGFHNHFRRKKIGVSCSKYVCSASVCKNRIITSALKKNAIFPPKVAKIEDN
jgi:hypothetical protein